MGPGGLRGLQILRSGVQSVRGGFDSHAFPPLLALTLAAALLLPPARAAAQEAGSTPADSARAPATAVAADSTASARPAIQRGDAPRIRVAADSVRAGAPARARWFDQPRWVMLRSLVVPGWGQLHNRAWAKALLIAGGEGLLGVRMLDDRRALDRLQREAGAAERAGDPAGYAAAAAAYNRRLDRLTGREWLLAGAVVYSLLDAYVDAHFRNFRLEFERDPALPEGVLPPNSISAANPTPTPTHLRWVPGRVPGRVYAARLSWRWSF
jgi:hypothetical protein